MNLVLKISINALAIDELKATPKECDYPSMTKKNELQYL